MPHDIWKPHATVAAVIERDGLYLLVEETCAGQPMFNQPAGHLEDGESLYAAVVREVREETAFLFHPEALIGCYRWRDSSKQRTHLRTTFSGTVSDEDLNQALDTGIIAAHWLSYAEIIDGRPLRSPLVRQSLDDYRAGHRYPLTFLRDLET